MAMKALKSISCVAMVLIVLSIIPSEAFASENSTLSNSTDPGYDPKFCPAGNITDGNFTEVQTNILNSISKKITELQSFYSDVNKVSNASDLQKILSSHRQTNECMGLDERHKGPDEMNNRSRRMPELFGLNQVENVTDANYTDLQTEITDSLGNMTKMLETEQTRLKEAGEDNRAKELGERITDLQNLSNNVSEASTAAELQKVVFTYTKTKAVNSLENKVEHLQVKVSESKNTSDEISSRITELNGLIEDINGAKSLGDLKDIMSSSREMPGMGRDNPMHHGNCDCPIDPSRTQDNSTDNSTET